MMPVPLRGAGRPHKDNCPDELHVSVLTGRCKRIKALLRKGVHIESVNCHGQTPLFCASWGGDTEVVTLLLRLGANPDRRCGSSGATPVHAACYRGSRRVLRLLVEAGANLSATDTDNLTPRDYAEKQPSPIRRQKILSFLDLVLAMTLHRGHPCDPLRRHHDGSSPGPAPGNTFPRRPGYQGLSNTLDSTDSRRGLNKSTLNLSKKSLGSVSSVWAACVAGELPTHTPKARDSTLHTKHTTQGALHKSVSCHLVDQLCVTTSLPLLAPTDLQKSTTPGLAYTCGGPTVYSPYTWLGTPVTVRRPTPALTLSSKNKNGGKPDGEAVLSLLEELSILRRLRHPAFLEVMAVCHVPQPDHVTLVFQHVPYGSLYHHLHVMHRDVSVCGAVEMLVGVVEGLLFLHAHGWLHCGLSSHALHLVSTSHAKLGSFQHAVQQQTKGECSMKADQLSRATWLSPWQAPEIIAESMVSIKSEVYALAAIIWEIWAGMPPWSGVTEEDIRRRVSGGESLPYLQGTPPSLVMYLTQYGLKWNAHERDLDLHEIHTMLRSLRVQVDEDERVPSVPSWGPPSVPNTPVVGRLVHSASPSPCGNNNKNKADSPDKPVLISNNRMSPPVSSPSSGPSTSSVRSSSAAEFHPSQYLQFVTIDQSFLSSASSASSVHAPVTRSSNVQQIKHPNMPPANLFTVPNRRSSVDEQKLLSMSQQFSVSNSTTGTPQSKPRTLVNLRTHQSNIEYTSNIKNNNVRTPSPFTDAGDNSKIVPSMVTSTPNRPTSSSLRSDLQPDLLPSKYVPNTRMPCITPDVLSRGKQENSLQQNVPSVRLRTQFSSRSKYSANRTSSSSFKTSSASEADKINPMSDSDTDQNQEFAYISNNAKRAFFTDSEGSKSPSPTNEKKVVVRRHRASVDSGIRRPHDKEAVKKHTFEAQDVKGPIRTDVVRRGLSLSNLLNLGGGSMVTRTFSHVSLCSADSSAGSSASSVEARRPQRTISQVTLTFKKLSTAESSSSSSSRDELEQASKNNSSAVDDAAASQNSSRYRRSKSLPKSPQNTKSPRQWEEVTGIKPASHSLTRHSSSCSLSSGGPPSPVHQFVNPAVRSKHESLPTSPIHHLQNMRPNSTLGAGFSSFGSTVSIGEASIRVNPRRHSDAPKPRPRRVRRKPDIEPEGEFIDDEFIDDEFNAELYEQPHMQLSVGSSENLLDTRLTATSMMADDSVGLFSPMNTSPSNSNISGRNFNGCLLGSCFPSARQHTPLNALPENSDEDLSLTLAQSQPPAADTVDNVKKSAGGATWLMFSSPGDVSTSAVAVNKSGAALVNAAEETAEADKFSESGISRSSSNSSNLFSIKNSPLLYRNRPASPFNRSVITDIKLDGAVSDSESTVSSSPSRSDFGKEYEPLKSVQLLRNMGKSLSLYLPKHSIGSDSDVENL